MVWDRDGGAIGAGTAAAEIAARAHEDVDDDLEFLIADAIDRPELPRPTQDADIGARNMVEMLLVTDRCEGLGFVENAQEIRHLADEIEESAEPFDLLPRRLRGCGPLLDEMHHVKPDRRQQLIEQLLPIFEVIVERALGDAGRLGDAGDRRLGITKLADDPGCGEENPALGPGIALDAVELPHPAGFFCRGLRHVPAPCSARDTTLPEGVRGGRPRRLRYFSAARSGVGRACNAMKLDRLIIARLELPKSGLLLHDVNSDS